MQRIDGAGHVNNLFVAEDAGANRPPTEITAGWLNGIQEELIAMITAAGLVPSATDQTQLVQALIKKGLQQGYFNVGAAEGSADALSATFAPAITALTNGMTLCVRAASANATATPTFTPAGGVIAAKGIVKGAGSALAAGDIAGTGHWLELTYDAALDKWVLQNPAKGVVAQEYASAAEAQAFSLTNKAITPATLAAALQGANQSLGTNGYQQLPGRLIIQWGAVTSVGTAPGNATATFPIAFPNACLQAAATACGPENMDRTVQFSSTSMSKTELGMSALRGNSSPSYTEGILVRWIAIGY